MPEDSDSSPRARRASARNSRDASLTPRPLNRLRTPSRLCISTLPSTASPSFNFQAPQYHDFSLAEDHTADKWFDTHNSPDAIVLNTTMTTRDVFSFLEIETPNLPETPVAKRVVEPVEEQHVCKTPKALDQVSKLVDDDQDEPEEECKVKAPLIKKSPSRILKKVVSRTQEATAFAEPAKRLLRPRAQSKAAADLKRDILALKKRKAAGTVQKRTVKPKPKPTQKAKLPAASTAARMNTVPKPFVFQKRPAKPQPRKPPYIPLASMLAQFPTGLDRTKSKPVNKRIAAISARLTQPQSPQLLTRLRSQATSAPLSSEILELQELKARPKVKPTALDRKMLKDGVVRGVPDLIKLPLTIPMSPMIQKPKRKPPAPTNDSRIIRARGVPPPTAVFQPQLAHRLVEPTEYSIPGEVISKRKKQVFMEKLAKEEQAKADQKVFKAHPVPTAPPLAIEHVVKVTEPVAFVLETEMRAQMHPAPYQEPQPVFVAHPAPTSAPFVPQPSDKPLTEPAPLALNTDIRADRRREFDSRVAQEMREQEQIDLQLTERQKGAEKIALKELRKKLVHKASNVRRFPLVAIKQSDKELTTPHSPRISKRTSRQNTLDK